LTAGNHLSTLRWIFSNWSGTSNFTAMHSNFLRVAAAACLFHIASALMGSMVGARINFRLDDNFEQNNRIIFTYRSVFDKSDGMGDATGIVFRVLDYPRGPSLDYADKFGVLKITALGTYVTTYPNNFTVLFIDGDMIEGEMEVVYTLPPGSVLDPVAAVLENDSCLFLLESSLVIIEIMRIAQVQQLPLQ
jgi:hypothetical protein